MIAFAEDDGVAPLPRTVSNGDKVEKGVGLKADKPGVPKDMDQYDGNKGETAGKTDVKKKINTGKGLQGNDGDSEGDEDIVINEYELELGDADYRTIPAETCAAYQVSGAYDTPCHIVVDNMTETEDSELSVFVVTEDGDIKYEISADDAYAKSQSAYDEDGDSDVLWGGYWCSYMYTLDYGDGIILAAGSEDVEASIIVQEIINPMDNMYGLFDYEFLYSEAQLIRLDRYSSDPNKAVMYLENNSSQEFSYYVCDGSGSWITDSFGYSWDYLEPDYYTNTGYNFSNSKDYYLMIFYLPGQADTNYSYWDYDVYADEDYYDYALAVSPQNVASYRITGYKNKTYTGKVHKPRITVEYCNVILGSADCSISYSNNKNVGTATVTIKGKSPQTGTVKKTFKINPKGTSLSKVTRAKKAFTVKWKKQATKMSKARITGYQIQYSTNSKFKSGNKTVTVKGYKNTSKKIKKLKKKKKYYVRIRTYMKVGKKTYYSGWSKAKSVKTK